MSVRIFSFILSLRENDGGTSSNNVGDFVDGDKPSGSVVANASASAAAAAAAASAASADPPPPMLNIHTDLKGFGLSTAVSDHDDPVDGNGTRQNVKGKGKAKEVPHESPASDSSMLIAHLLPCGHNMHDECLKPWVARANSCPICRQVIHEVELLAYVGGPVISSYPVKDRTRTVAPTDFDTSTLSIYEEDTFSPTISQPCPICGLDDNEDVLLLCDSCDSAYHTYCVGLTSVPSGQWFCESCELQRAIALSMQEPLPFARSPTGRRTRAQVRRSRRRRGAERAQWARVWQSVWGRMSFESDHRVDTDGENDDRSMIDDIHDDATSTYSDEERQREIEEGTYGFGTPGSPFEMYEIRQQALMERRAEIQADRRAWERRLRVAESQGRSRPTPHGSNASQFADTRHSLLVQEAQEHITRNWPSRPVERVKTPEPQTLDEIRAWEAFDRAMAGEDSPVRTPRGRKRAAGSIEGIEDAQDPDVEENPARPSRPLKRPRTRRPEQLLAMRNANTGSENQVSARASTAASRAGSAATSNTPTFLQSLLKEVEDSTSSPNLTRCPRPANVPRPPRPLFENSRAGGRSTAIMPNSPSLPQSSSRSGSSSNCSSPRFSHASTSPGFTERAVAGNRGIATAATPPTSVADSPMATPGGSPAVKGESEAELMTMFSPNEDGARVMSDYQKSPTPTDSRRAIADHGHRQQQQQQHHHHHRRPHHDEHSHPYRHRHHQEGHRDAAGRSSSSDRRPTSPSALSFSSKSLLQTYVSSALKPYWRRQTISAAEYTDINRRVSRSLYERAGADEAVLSKAVSTVEAETGAGSAAASAFEASERKKVWWQGVAKELVEEEIQSVVAKRGARVPVQREQGSIESGNGHSGTRRTPAAATTVRQG
ncbi:hypothetical protein KEM54_001878 [Ascosphaera aggregata]|nr:hypothetical protein KEM54_001878 [Ascosphaera aggregata]